MWFEISEGAARIGVFVGVLVTMALLELLIPRRTLSTSKMKRWLTNITIAGLGNAAVRLMGLVAAPVVALTAALYAETQGWGLLPLLGMPFWLLCLISIVILDFAIYFQHVLSHQIPFLWRFHRVHHADIDFDVTTAVRFHPIEIVLSMLYKVVWVFLLGAPVFAVFLFEVILSSTAMFNHSNIRLPLWLDRVLRLFIVTPDMHRVHHSVYVEETNSNYGFSLPIWDYVFGTYVRQPKDGHTDMTIGLEEYQTQKPRELWWSLILPFSSGRRARSEEGNISE